MWELETIDITRNTAASEERKRTLLSVAFTLTNGEESVDLTTDVESKDVLDRTIRNHIQRLNAQEELIANADSYTVPEPQQPEPPTAVEKARQDFDSALAELEELQNINENVDGLDLTNQINNQENAVRNAWTEYQNAKNNS